MKKKKNDLVIFGLVILISIIIAVVMSLVYRMVQEKKIVENPKEWESEDAIVLMDKTIDVDSSGPLNSMVLNKVILYDNLLYFVGKFEVEPNAGMDHECLINNDVYLPVEFRFYSEDPDNKDIRTFIMKASRTYFDVLDINNIDSLLLHVETDLDDNRTEYVDVRIENIGVVIPEGTEKVDKMNVKMSSNTNPNYDVYLCGTEMSDYNCAMYLKYVGGNENISNIDPTVVCINDCKEFVFYTGYKDKEIKYYSGAGFLSKMIIPISDVQRQCSLPIHKLVVNVGDDEIVFDNLNIQQ